MVLASRVIEEALLTRKRCGKRQKWWDHVPLYLLFRLFVLSTMRLLHGVFLGR